MKKLLLLLLSIYATTSFGQFKYPASKKVDSTNTYFGVTYHDQYQWMENMKDTSVVSWFKQQATFTNNTLDKITGRTELLAEWLELDKLHPDVITDRVYESGRLFYKKRRPGEKVAKLYYREGMNGEEQLLFDPLDYIKGKVLSVESFIPSFDGKQIAIGYSSNGAEILTIKIMDVASKQFLKDEIFPAFSLNSWTFDNRAILYTWIKSANNADPQSRLNSKTRLHMIGADPKDDIDFFSNASYANLNIGPSMYPFSSVTDENKNYIFSSVSDVKQEANAYYAPIAQLYSGKIQWKQLCTPADKLVRGAVFIGDKMFAITYKDAKNYKLVESDIENPDWQNAKTVVPEKGDETLEAVSRCKDYIMLTYNDGINSHIYKYNPSTGNISEIKLPLSGTATISCLDNKTNNCIVSVTSWVKPLTEFDFDAVTEKFTESTFNKPLVYPESFNNQLVKEVEVKGHDGVMIPLTIIYRKGTKLDGNNVCLMDGYGAYGNSISPGFDLRENSLVAKGVVVAIAHVRGGSEKGQDWYKGGFKTTKPNTWKDFNSCAEYLIKNGWTKSSKLAASGGSAGGILISRAITERPDLYAAVICNVGVANAMRVEFSANGPNNIAEFGTVKDSVECRALYEMDGLQHVVNGTKYPAVICIAGWNDPRVIAWEPGKFAAALQNASASDKPVLMKVNYNSGHFTEDRSVGLANVADQFAFLMWQCGQPGFTIKTE
jgi:prolyl oligopeptidase